MRRSKCATTPAAETISRRWSSAGFEGKGLIERHQLVYKALGDAMRVQVHALTSRR